MWKPESATLLEEEEWKPKSAVLIEPTPKKEVSPKTTPIIEALKAAEEPSVEPKTRIAGETAYPRATPRMLEAARLAMSDVPIPTLPPPQFPKGTPRDIRPPQAPAIDPRMGLAERAGKQFLNKFAFDIVESWRPSSLATKGRRINAERMKNYRRTSLGKQWENMSLGEKAKHFPEYLWADLKAFYGLSSLRKQAMAQAKLQEKRGRFGFEVPAAETALEKYGIDVPTGLGAFISQLLIAKKILPPGGLLTDMAAWELVNTAAQGIPGEGAATAAALGGVATIPAKTVLGKGGKIALQSTVLGGKTAAMGGSAEDIAVAAALPPLLAAFRLAPAAVRGKIDKVAVNKMKQSFVDKGINIDRVPDSAFNSLLKTKKDIAFWKNAHAKGKITKDTLDMRMGRAAEELTPILEAIARQQPIKQPPQPTKPPARVAEKPPQPPPITQKPSPSPPTIKRGVGKAVPEGVAKVKRPSKPLKGQEVTAKERIVEKKAPEIPTKPTPVAKLPAKVVGMGYLLNDGTILKDMGAASHINLVQKIPKGKKVVDAGFLDSEGNYLMRDDVIKKGKTYAFVEPDGTVLQVKIVEDDVEPEMLMDGITIKLPNGERYDIERSQLLEPVEEQFRGRLEQWETAKSMDKRFGSDYAGPKPILKSVAPEIPTKPTPVAPEAEGKEGFYHGSPSGDLRGGKTGLHIGTYKAAKQALEARIGIPAEGEWDGTKKYGETLLAGQNTLKKLDPKGFNRTGVNVNVPKEDYYPTGKATYSDGTKVSMNSKPNIVPVKIKGEMINTAETAKGDFAAGAAMAGQIKRGRAKRGYYYKNISEDAGSISAVVPSAAHLELQEKEFEIEPGKFYTQAKIDEAITKGEMGEIEIEPVLEAESKSFNKHIDYLQTRQLPETSQIRKIQKQMQVVNGQRLAGTITAKEANKKIQQLKKALFKTAEKEGIALRMTKGGKVSVAVRKAGTYVPVEFAEYKKFQDIYPRAQDVTRSIQQIDGALSVKEKKKMPGQAGMAEQHILWPTREMHMQKDRYVKEKAAQLKKILTVKEGSKKDTKINDVLEKIAKADRDKPIKDVLSAKTIKAMGATPDVVNQAVALRKWYDELLDEQNTARRIRDQEEIPYRRNYSPHILRDATIWERITTAGKTAEDVFGKKAPIPDYIRPNKPFNPREMARKAGIRYEERIKSATELAGRYLSTAAKDIFNTSIIQNNKAFIQQLEAMGYEKPARYLADWTSQAYAGIMPSLDRALLLGETPKARKGMMKWNQVRNLAVFPLNVGWTLGTQIKSFAMTIGRYGSVNATKGFYQWLKPSIRRQAAEDYYSFIVKSAKQGKVTRQDAKNLIGEEVKLRRTKGEMARDLTTLFLEEMEKLLTGTSIRAAHLHGAKRGLTGEALKNYASDGGAKTQSMYNDEDKPLFLTNLTVKTVTPYQTYCYETMNTLREWAGRTGTPPESKMYAIWSLVRYLAAMTVLNQIEASVRGRKWSWLRLVPMPFSELWLSPIYKHFTKERLPGGSGLLSPIETASRIAKGVDDVLETGSWRKLRNELVKYGPGLFSVPGGVQWARLTDAIIAYSQGGVYDRRGKLLFKMKDPQDLVRAIFTGVWTTKGGRQYIEKRTGLLTVSELREAISKSTYKRPYKRKGGGWYSVGQAHKGKEEYVKSLREELRRRKEKRMLREH